MAKPPSKSPSKSKKQLEREIQAAVGGGGDGGSASWGPVMVADVPPVAGTTLDVDGRSYAVVPAATRLSRTAHGERELARATKRNQDDAWLVIAPDRESVLGMIVGAGRQWSIYRKAGDVSSRGGVRTWRKDEEAEVTYRRGFDGDWKSAVRGLAKMEL